MSERAGWQSPSGNLWKEQAKHEKQEKQNSEAGLDLVTEKLHNYSVAGAGWTRKKNIDSGMSEQGLEAAGSWGTTWP